MKDKKFGKPIQDSIRQSLRSPAYRRSYRKYRTRTEIAAAIKTLREARGMTRNRLAESAGLTRAGIARLESVRHARLPTVPQLLRVFSALGSRASLRIVSGAVTPAGMRSSSFRRAE